MGSNKKFKEAPQSNDTVDPQNANSGSKPEGPVLAALSRRLRAVKKKLNRVEELEEGLANGKQPHPDQEGLLKSKPALLAAIEELEKLGALVKDAVKEELDAYKQQLVESHQAELDEIRSDLAAKEAALAKARAEAEAAQAEAEAAKEAAAQALPVPEPTPPVSVEQEKRAAVSEGVLRLIQLLYFSQMFDEAGPWSTASERKACVTYDYAVQLEGEPLTDEDLIAVSRFGKSLVTRPAGKLIDHQSMVEENTELAVKFLERGPEVLPELGCSVERVDERLRRVLASEYYTILPKVVLHEVPYEDEQAAANASAAGTTAAQPPAAAAPAAPAQPTGSVPFSADSHPRTIQQLPPMPNITASGNAILDDPAIAMSQLSRTGASIPPPPAVGPPKQMVPPGSQVPGGHTGQQIHRSQMPPVLQQLLGGQPPAYPGYMPQPPVPMPGFGVAPPTQFGLQDPTVYSFGSLSGIDINTSAPMDSPMPTSLPPPTTSAAPPAQPHPSPVSHAPTNPHAPAYPMPPAMPDHLQNAPPRGLPPHVNMLPNGALSPPLTQAMPGGSHLEGPQAAASSVPPSNQYGPPAHHFPPRGDRGGFERGRGGRGRGGGGGRGVNAAPPGDSAGRGGRGGEREMDQRGERPRGSEGRGGFRGGRGGRDGRRGRGQGPPGPQGMPGGAVMFQPPPPGPPMMIPPQAQYSMQ